MPRKIHDPAPKDPGFHRRLHAACKLADVQDQTQLMRRLKINRQTAHKWWHGQSSPEKMRAVDIFRIADGLKVSARWLLDGGGQMLPGKRLTPDEHQVIEIFNSFKPENQGWRDDWVSEGVRRLERLNLSPTLSNPFPVPQR